MDKPMSSVGFKFMNFAFRVRDLLQSRMDVLKEAGIEPGFCVLDYGCGPAAMLYHLHSWLVPQAKFTRSTYIHSPSKKYRRKLHQKAIKNLKTINSDCSTGLPDCKVDVVLLYDIFHNLSLPDDVLRELHRVLKPDGTLSFSDHHMKEKDIRTRVTNTGLFKLLTKGKKTYRFSKVG